VTREQEAVVRAAVHLARYDGAITVRHPVPGDPFGGRRAAEAASALSALVEAVRAYRASLALPTGPDAA